MHNSWLGRHNGRAAYSGDREINETFVSTPGNIVPKSRRLMYSQWNHDEANIARGSRRMTTTTTYIPRNITRLSDVATRSCIRRMKALPRFSLFLSLSLAPLFSLPLSTHRDASLLNLPLFVARECLSELVLLPRKIATSIHRDSREDSRSGAPASALSWGMIIGTSPPECSAHYATERVTISGTSNISSETNARTILRISSHREISFRARLSHSIPWFEQFRWIVTLRGGENERSTLRIHLATGTRAVGFSPPSVKSPVYFLIFVAEFYYSFQLHSIELDQ